MQRLSPWRRWSFGRTGAANFSASSAKQAASVKATATLLIAACSFVVSGCVSVEGRSTGHVNAPAQAMVQQAALDAYIELRRQRRAELWRAFPAKQEAVVFAGSSIIEEGPFEGMFPDYNVVNRGIGADTTVGFLDRLDEIIALQPGKLFLYIGGNDRSRLDDTPEAAFARLEEIVRRVRASSPSTEIYVHTLFPREQRHGKWIEGFNALVREIETTDGMSVIDLHPLALGEDGAIDPALTNDGIHLLPEGYRRWQELLRRDFLPALDNATGGRPR